MVRQRTSILSGVAAVALTASGQMAVADTFNLNSNTVEVEQGASTASSDFRAQFFTVMTSFSLSAFDRAGLFSSVSASETVSSFGAPGDISGDAEALLADGFTPFAATVSDTGNGTFALDMAVDVDTAASAWTAYQTLFSQIFTGNGVASTGTGGVDNVAGFDVRGANNFAAVSQAGEGNDVATNQDGDANTIYALQSGYDASAAITQSGGDGNVGVLAQIGTLSEDNGSYTFGPDGVSFADMSQTGYFNVATLTQLGNTGLSSATLTQTGDFNAISAILGAGGTSSVGAFDAENPVFDTNLTIDQSGNENAAVVSVVNGAADVSIRQVNDFNWVDVAIDGTDNVLDLTQNGFANFSAFIAGDGNVIGSLADMSGSYAGAHQGFNQAAGASATLEITSNSNAVMLEQTAAATLYLSIDSNAGGGGNEIYISQAGIGAVADLSLFGENNEFRVTQTAGATRETVGDVTYGQAVIDLTGNKNNISITQSAKGYASVIGTGNRNEITIEQTVDYVSAEVTVSGNNLSFDLLQNGTTGTSVVVEELTNGKKAKVCQGNSCS